MNGRIAKRLRKMALTEMMGDGVPKRDLVMGNRSVVNSPQSVRAMYLKLKAAYKHTTCSPRPLRVRAHKASGFYRKQTGQCIALIQSPLKHLKAYAKLAADGLDGGAAKSIYAQATAAAKRGHGYTVRLLAQLYA